jgi:hypothetical protein
VMVIHSISYIHSSSDHHNEMRLAIIVVRILSSNEELRFQEKECLSPNKPPRFKSKLVAKGFS